MSLIVWLYDDPSGTYHSAACRCEQHCGNCLASLDVIREEQEKLAAGGKAVRPVLHPLARYCSAWCKGRAARERALDRRLAASCTTPMRSQP